MRYQGGVQFARNTMFNFAGIFSRSLYLSFQDVLYINSCQDFKGLIGNASISFFRYFIPCKEGKM